MHVFFWYAVNFFVQFFFLQVLFSLFMLSFVFRAGYVRHCKVEEEIDQWEECVVYFRRPQKSSAAAGVALGVGRSAAFASEPG